MSNENILGAYVKYLLEQRTQLELKIVELNIKINEYETKQTRPTTPSSGE